ncbi:ATP-binding cassette domain-containing protein [Streptomyces sp. NPDC056716]|uniref:ATP-binding cassette domain-containing protein n=1 Tax=unclassified Streptomyces TaxID=2593676 RepID=UPI0036BE5ED6
MTRDGTSLRVEGISKSFPGVKALDDVSFTIRPGTVHALCAENGAGKSTLMKIIDGLYQPDEGRIFVKGRETRIRNPIEARDLGIAMIAQELHHVPDITVAENFFPGRLPVRRGRVDRRRIKREAREILDSEHLEYKPSQKLSSLTVSGIQMLEIVRAVHHNADLIIMDEPTSAITQRDVARLFEQINTLKAEGAAVIYISHKRDEVFEIADDITVLRDGQVVSTDRAARHGRPSSSTSAPM